MQSIYSHMLRLAKDSFIYGLASIGNAFVGLFLLPIFTRVFVPEQYGAIEIILTTQALAASIADMQIASGVARFYYENKDEQRRVLVTTGLFLSLPLPLLVTAVAVIFGTQLSVLLFSTPAYGAAISIASFNILLSIITGYQLLVIRFKNQAVLYSVLAVGNAVLQAILSIYFVISLHTGVNGVFLGTLITNAATTVVVTILNRKFFASKFSRVFARDIIVYSLPLIPGGIVSWFRTYIQRFLLLPLIGLASVGIFSGAIRISSVVMLVISSFRLGWTPFAMSVMKETNNKEIYSKTMTLFTLLLTAVSLVFTVFAYEFVHILMGPDYWESSLFVGPLSAALVFDGIFLVGAIGLAVVKKVVMNTVAFVIGVAVGIGSMVALVPHMGLMGAAISTLLSSAAAALSQYYFAQKLYPIDYEKKVLLVFVAILIISIPITILVDKVTPWQLRIGIKIVELGILFLGLWFALPPGEAVYLLRSIGQQLRQIGK